MVDVKPTKFIREETLTVKAFRRGDPRQLFQIDHADLTRQAAKSQASCGILRSSLIPVVEEGMADHIPISILDLFGIQSRITINLEHHL